MLWVYEHIFGYIFGITFWCVFVKVIETHLKHDQILPTNDFPINPLASMDTPYVCYDIGTVEPV